jgi:hypothetical protein
MDDQGFGKKGIPAEREKRECRDFRSGLRGKGSDLLGFKNKK